MKISTAMMSYIGLVLLATVLIRFTCAFIYRYIIKHLESSHRIWDDALLRALYKPLCYAIWLWGLAFSLQLFFSEYVKPKETIWIFRISGAITIVLVSWFLYRLIHYLDVNYHKSVDKYKEILDQTTANAIIKCVKVIILLFTFLLILKQFFHFQLTGLWALGGVGSIIIGFAAKDMLANFFGGFMFFFDKPFSIGDLIRLPAHQLEGVVERIGWRLTQIRTKEMLPLYVPNSVFSTASIENLSNRSYRLIDEIIRLRYEDVAKLNEITDEIAAMLKAHPEIDNHQPCYAYLKKCTENALDVNIYCYTNETKGRIYYQIKQSIMIKILEILEKNNAKIAPSERVLESLADAERK